MRSVAILVLALTFLSFVYLGVWYPAYASTGSCHQSCTATWQAAREAALTTWVECKTGCTHLSGHAKTACSVQCFQDRNAELTEANNNLRQCFRACK
jgi:hypothetical protein